jgi:hypothetical protein
VAGCLLLTGVCLNAGAVVAQTPFALTNIGANIEMYTARLEGRGGWGMAENDTLQPGFKNPAALAPLRAVTVLFGGYAETRESQTPDAVRETNRVITPTILAAIPLFGGRIVAHGGFLSHRATQYKTVVPTSWPSPTGTDSVYGEQHFARAGTQFDIPLGLAWSPFSLISVGAAVNLVHGSIAENLTNFFRSPVSPNTGAPLYLPASQETNDEFNGTSYTYSFLLNPFRFLQMGGAYTMKYDLDVQRTTFIGGVATRADSSFVLKMPWRYSVGAALRFGSRFRIGADYGIQGWSEFEGREDWAAVMQDEEYLTVGLDLGHGHTRGAGWRNWAFRLGGMLRRWGYQVGGNEIEEKRLSLGTGFNFANEGGHLDIAISHSWVGDLEQNGMEDRVWRVALSVSAMEKWWGNRD